MKALTVRQPWASLIVHGPKWIETRTRRTHVRGRIGIIAGLYEPADMSSVGDFTYWRRSPAGWIDRKGVHEVTGHEIEAHRGALIGTVELCDCVPIDGDGDLIDLFDWNERDCPSGGPVLEVGGPAFDESLNFWAHGDGEHPDGDWSDQLPYGDFTPGRWAWLLRDPQPLAEPIPMRGALGWQEVDL